VPKAQRLVLNWPLTVYTSYDLGGILNAKGELWLSVSYLLKYQVQDNNTQGILCLEEGYLFVGRSWKKNQVWGLPCVHPNHTQGNWAVAQRIPNLEHISFWNIIQQTVFSQ
jgi:hypothetical protein